MSDRVVLAHGFTQTARSWTRVDAELRRSLPAVDTVAVDLPGHGTAHHITTDLWGAADHVVSIGGTGAYVGYSMGGRVALHAALRHPESVERLVLIGATGGIVDDDERAERRANDERLAARIERIGVEQFVDEWLAQPLFADLDAQSAMRDDRLRNTAAGLATSLRTCGTGTQQPLWDRLHAVRCPTLVVVGERDAKFRELGERLSAGIADCRLAVIDGSGHSCHLQAPGTAARAIAEFLTGPVG